MFEERTTKATPEPLHSKCFPKNNCAFAKAEPIIRRVAQQKPYQSTQASETASPKGFFMRLSETQNLDQLIQHQRHRMKALWFVLVLLFFTSVASAQVPAGRSANPDVIVLQKKWREEYRNAALEEDPFKAQSERDQEDRARINADRQNEIKKQQGMPTSPPPDPKFSNKARGISVAYIYEVKFKNTGAKEIRTLTWEYVFFDPATNREVGRRRFVSKVSIGPGKTKKVVENSSSPPTGSIDVAKAGKKSQDLFSEQVMIQSIAYADGSIWKAASN